MRTFVAQNLSDAQYAGLLQRPGMDFLDILPTISSILRSVETEGDDALRRLSIELDKVDLRQFAVSAEEFDAAEEKTSLQVREAIRRAGDSLNLFHRPQQPASEAVQTARGVQCRLEWRPIERVGLYVPGGSAPLLSTVLMLGVPARLAGCPDIVLCTPPRRDGSVSPDILVAARSLGITTVFKIGGAQAIAAMAVGTRSVPKVRKIFGPGNRYVTAMKSLVARPPHNVAIDMLAGPSELLVVADDSANVSWVAADLLSQAEHGIDSPVILVTPSPELAERVTEEISAQLASLPRNGIAMQALEKSFVLLVNGIAEAIDFSNSYAPEHLILAVGNAESLSSQIVNAGSVFLGPLTSVVFGDYASGTNHTLPTGGLAASCGGLTVRDFLKPVFFQSLDATGLGELSQTVKALARAEGLEAHARAVEARERVR